MSDLSISVGAENEATRILDQISKDVAQIGHSSQQMGQVTTRSFKRIEVAAGSLKATAAPLIAAFAAFKGAMAAIGGVGSAIEAFNTQEEAVRRLDKALELAGENAAGQVSADFQVFASQLQRVVNVGDEVSIRLAAQASTLGVSGDQLKAVTEASVGLSEALGISLDEALKKTVNAINGNAGALAEFIPEIRNASTEQEKLAAVMEVANRGFEQAADKAQTGEGAWVRIGNTFGDLLEQVGALIDPFANLAANGLDAVTQSLDGSLAPAIDNINSWFDSMAPMIEVVTGAVGKLTTVFVIYAEDTLGRLGNLVGAFFGWGDGVQSTADTVESALDGMFNFLIGGLSVIDTVWNEFPTIFEIAADAAMLHIVGLVEDFKHAFTVQIPALLQSFADNWQALLSGLATGDFEFTFPELVQRELTDLEVSLRSDIANSAAELAGAFNASFEERISRLDASKPVDEFEKSLDKLAGFDLANTVDFSSLGELLAKGVSTGQKAISQAVKGAMDVVDFDAMFEPTLQVQSNDPIQATQGRLLTRGPSDDPAQAVAQNTAKMVSSQEKTLDTLNQIQENTAEDSQKTQEPNFLVQLVETVF